MIPDLDALRNEALLAGAMDPMSLRYRIVEYDKADGKLLNVMVDDIGFSEAIEQTSALVREHSGSQFCLQPVGFLQ